MIYGLKPNLLESRTKMRMMVEAIMSKESREAKPIRRPALKGGLTQLKKRDRLSPVEDRIDPVLAPNAKLRKAIASLPAPKARSKAKTRE